MVLRSSSPRFLRVLAAAVLLALAVSPLSAEWRPVFPRRCEPSPYAPCPPPEWRPVTPPTPPTPEPGREPAPAPEPPTVPIDLSGERAAAVGGSTVALGFPGLKGDQLGLAALAFRPPTTFAQRGLTQAVLAPSVRTFKLTDNESPGPQDRVYFGFNYFDDVAAALNRHYGIDIHDIRVYRETFGVEKTFLDQDASVGIRFPLNTLSASSPNPDFQGTDTAVGDLSVIFKYAFWRDEETGSLLSSGLAVTAPTGPSRFAHSAIPVRRDTLLQPFLGYILARDRWFLHGFLAVDVPTDSRDVTLLYNDIGVGYYLYRNPETTGLLTAVAPTLEVHVSNPLNHRGALRTNDPAGTADIVNLTAATTFELGANSRLAVGLVTPLTGPRPFDFEVQVQFNWYFGGRDAVGTGRIITAAY